MEYRWSKKGRELLEEINTTSYPDSLLCCWYIGQMGLVVKWKDIIICLDPVLHDLCREDGSTRRNYETPFAPEDFTGVAAVLGTHLHTDHLDRKTFLPLSMKNPEAKVIVPAPLCKEMVKGGISKTCLTGASEGSEIIISKDVSVIPVAAAHETYQVDENGDHLCMGYILDIGGFRIYHAGDTLVTSRLLETLSSYRPFHMAFLPINGTDEERRQRGIIGNMGCRDAVYLSRFIEADVTIPLHYDMIKGNGEDPLHFASCMQMYAPGRKHHIMVLGERYIYGR